MKKPLSNLGRDVRVDLGTSFGGRAHGEHSDASTGSVSWPLGVKSQAMVCSTVRLLNASTDENEDQVLAVRHLDGHFEDGFHGSGLAVVPTIHHHEFAFEVKSPDGR